MQAKDIALKSIGKMPESSTWEEIEERILFLAAIDKGLEEIKSGKTVPHEKVKASLEKWISE